MLDETLIMQSDLSPEELRKSNHRFAQRQWYKKHPEKGRAASARWRAANPEKDRESRRRGFQKWYAENKVEANAKVVAWRKSHPEHARQIRKKSFLKTQYGLTREQLTIMLEEQGGLCKLCHEVLDTPCVDHDHETGRVRGLIHRHCNLVLGNSKDSVLLLQQAIEYLKAAK